MQRFLLAAVALVGFALSATADDKKAEEKKANGPLTLKLITKSDKYKFDGGGKTPDEYKKHLEGLGKGKGGLAAIPNPAAVDLVLQITNTGTQAVTIYVGGDSNFWTFELTGGSGSVALPSNRPMTLEFRLPKAVTLEPGKSHEIPVKALADGVRGMSRFVYWTGPGEYMLSAKYQLADSEDGGKGKELKSAPIKITVEK